MLLYLCYFRGNNSFLFNADYVYFCVDNILLLCLVAHSGQNMFLKVTKSEKNSEFQWNFTEHYFDCFGMCC